MSSLEQRLDSFPEPWKPKTAGDKLIGELTDVDLRESEYGDPYSILTVLVESGSENGQPLEPDTERAWHAFHTMARSEVAKKRPQIGERVGIVYAGVGVAQPGMNAPERWRLLVDRPAQSVSYDTPAGGATKNTGEPGGGGGTDGDIPF